MTDHPWFFTILSSALTLDKKSTAEVFHIGPQGIDTNAKGTGQNHVLNHSITSVIY